MYSEMILIFGYYIHYHKLKNTKLNHKVSHVSRTSIIGVPN